MKDLAPAGYYLALRVGFHAPTEEVNALPKDWVEHYTRNRMGFADPANHWVNDNLGWVRWSDIDLPDPKGVRAAALEFGLRYGLAMSLADGFDAGQRSFAHFFRADRDFLPDEIDQLSAHLRHEHDRLAPPTNITPAELEVLRLIRDGLRQKEIAYQLGVSEGAVKQRLKNARLKLGATNGPQATSIAVSIGLI